MADGSDRTKLGKVALKKRPVGVGSAARGKGPRTAPPDELDSLFDHSFDQTFAALDDPGESEPPAPEQDSGEVTSPRFVPEIDAPSARSAAQPSGMRDPGAQEASAEQTGSLLESLAAEAGLPGVDLDRVVIDLTILEFLPREVAVRHMILPVAATDDQIFLAMSDPSQKRVIDELEFVTGRLVVPLIATHSQLRRLVEAAYRARNGGEKTMRGAHVGSGGGALQSAIIRPPGVAVPSPARGGAPVVPRDRLDPIDLDAPPPPPAEPEAAKRRASRKPRILVVDDEHDIRTLIVRVLREAGFEVEEAAKGTEALRAVQASMPDLLVLDAMLPEIHGFDVCRRIKKSEKYSHIPVIMISAIYRGWRFAHDLKASYGVDLFMEKPFKINDLVEKVKQYLSGAPPSEEAADRGLSGEAQRALESGVERYRAGDVPGAIAHLHRGIEIDPLSHRLHYHLGVLYGRQGEVYLAIHEMENALEIEPNDYSTLRSLAQLYEHAGFRFKAVEMWERAICASPDDAARSSIKEHLVRLL